MVAQREAREAEGSELRRYRADVAAARLPLGHSLVAGGLAGVAVFLVPLVVVGASFVLISLAYNFGLLPVQFLLRALGFGASRAQQDGAAAPGRQVAPAPRPTEVPAGPVESTLDAGLTNWGLVGLLIFWPVAMTLVGTLVAALYRARRRRRLDELSRTPLEFSILAEVALFYALTAGAGVLVNVGTFLALGANVIFSWAGYLIWRLVYDALAWRLAPASVRDTAESTVDRELRYRRSLRESG